MDLLETVIGVAPDSPLAELRARRPEVVRHTQGSHDGLMSPSDLAGLSLAERAQAALKVAELSGHAALTAHYRELAASRPQAPSPRLSTILAHVELVTTAPGKATKAHMEALAAAGLGTHAIVSLSQIIAFVSYQVRAAFGLALLTQETQS